MTTPEVPAELSWRIPDEGETQRYRIGALQILVATVFFAAIVVGAAPPDMILPGLAAIVPVAGLLLWRNWRLRGPRRKLPDNVQLGARGVAWLDESGGEHLFARELIESFQLARDEDTVRPVPALLLFLSGGFESQPLEVHEPVTPDDVRRVLVTRLHLKEQTPDELARRVAANTIRGLLFEFDDAEGIWEFRGPRPDLLVLCDRLAEIADKLAHFPPGARPLVVCVGSTPLRFSPATAANAVVIESSFFGPRHDLLTLAAKLGTLLEAAEIDTPVEAPVFEDAADAWHVRMYVQNV